MTNTAWLTSGARLHFTRNTFVALGALAGSVLFTRTVLGASFGTHLGVTAGTSPSDFALASTVDALAVDALLGTDLNTAVTARPEPNAEAFSLFANTIAGAVTRANLFGTVLTDVAFLAIAHEINTLSLSTASVWAFTKSAVKPRISRITFTCRTQAGPMIVAVVWAHGRAARSARK